MKPILTHITNMDNQDKNAIEIELNDSVAEGIYSNMVFIAHSHSEFVLDFISFLPGIPKARVKSRILIAPEHAKRLLLALDENINKYEYNFGEIKLENESENLNLPIDGIAQA